VYQSIFFPGYVNQNTASSGFQPVEWVGDVRALMVDTYGNMRVDLSTSDGGVTFQSHASGLKQINFYNEDLNNNDTLDTEDLNGNGVLDSGEDLNGNGRLDVEDLDGDGFLDYRDLILVFNDGVAELWDDVNENGLRDDEDQITFDPDIPAWHGNNTLDTEDTNGNGVLDTGEDINGNGRLDFEDLNGNGGEPETERVAVDYLLEDLVDNYLWRSREWLNNFSLNPLVQRDPYDMVFGERYIFTFVDADGDMIADADEVQDFSLAAAPTQASLTNLSNFYAYCLYAA